MKKDDEVYVRPSGHGFLYITDVSVVVVDVERHQFASGVVEM